MLWSFDPHILQRPGYKEAGKNSLLTFHNERLRIWENIKPVKQMCYISIIFEICYPVNPEVKMEKMEPQLALS